MAAPTSPARRRFLWRLGQGALALGLAGGGGYLYATRYEPEWLEVTHLRLRVPHLTLPIRLVQLSDWHLWGPAQPALIHRAIDLALDQEPDLICLTGDYVTNSMEDASELGRAFRRLASAAPTLAVMGNHDGLPDLPLGQLPGVIYRQIAEQMERNGVQLLHNAARTLEFYQGQRVRIAGVADLWSGAVHPSRALLETRNEDVPVVVLTHNPDTKELLLAYDWDVLLCGHTHGGQVCLPFIGAPIIPITDRSTTRGYYAWNKRHLYVNRGIGSLRGIRFNCRPEVSVIELVPN